MQSKHGTVFWLVIPTGIRSRKDPKASDPSRDSNSDHVVIDMIIAPGRAVVNLYKARGPADPLDYRGEDEEARLRKQYSNGTFISASTSPTRSCWWLRRGATPKHYGTVGPPRGRRRYGEQHTPL